MTDELRTPVVGGEEDDSNDHDLVRELRALGRVAVEVPPDLERRIMARVEKAGVPRRSLLDVLFARPWQISLAAALGLGLVGLGFILGRSTAPESKAPSIAGGEGDGPRDVRFVLARTGSETEGRPSHVQLAGDFNDWGARPATLRDDDGDGIWTASVPLPPGTYRYMFVVDGEWVTDPLAEAYRDDGFGNRNAVLRVD